jgi:hypothetical protein
MLHYWVRKQQKAQHGWHENRQNSEGSVNIKYQDAGNTSGKPRIKGGEYVDFEEIKNN